MDTTAGRAQSYWLSDQTVREGRMSMFTKLLSKSLLLVSQNAKLFGFQTPLQKLSFCLCFP